MKITIFEAEQWERKTFAKLVGEHELQFVSGVLNADNAGNYADSEIISVFIYSIVNEPVLRQIAKVKLLATRSTGIDHIDGRYCRANNISVCNVPAYGENTVAEHVFCLLLSLSHKLIEAVDRTRRGDFSLQGLQGFDLYGKTIGVIGTGAIGRCVIRISNGFGMNVLAQDVHPDPGLAKELGFSYADFDDLLARSDIITLHVPAQAATHKLISEREFSLMKDGAVLINTARGEVVDSVALVRALAEGKIAAAGLDVLSEEPAIHEEAELLRSVFQKKHNLETLLADQILLRQRNVVITPHNAFNTREAVERILITTVRNIEAYVSGHPLNMAINTINLTAEKEVSA